MHIISTTGKYFLAQPIHRPALLYTTSGLQPCQIYTNHRKISPYGQVNVAMTLVNLQQYELQYGPIFA